MNERIEKLAVEARQYAFAKVELTQDPTEWSTKYYNEMFEQKFAELIVRECANHCDLLLDHKISSEWSRGTHDCSRAIKQHFGVEE